MGYAKNMNIGLAGEYMVAGMLSIKGWYASLTLKNYPNIDIIAHKVGTENSQVGIQVKSTIGQSSILVGRLKKGASEETIRETIVKGIYVFVVFDKDEANIALKMPTFYIVPMNDMVTLVRKTNDAFFNKPRQIEVNDIQPIAIKIADLKPYENKWDGIC